MLVPPCYLLQADHKFHYMDQCRFWIPIYWCKFHWNWLKIGEVMLWILESVNKFCGSWKKLAWVAQGSLSQLNRISQAIWIVTQNISLAHPSNQLTWPTFGSGPGCWQHYLHAYLPYSIYAKQIPGYPEDDCLSSQTWECYNSPELSVDIRWINWYIHTVPIIVQNSNEVHK
jgi:hypothetical protein